MGSAISVIIIIGEIITAKQKPVFDEKKLREEEKFDGYYANVTSEWQKNDEEIIEIYRGLRQIEDAFKVTKVILKPALFIFHVRTILRRIS